MKKLIIHNILLGKVGYSLSGGDTASLELIKIWKQKYQNILYTTDEGVKIYTDNGLKGKNIQYQIYGSGGKYCHKLGSLNILISFIYRTISSLSHLPKLSKNCNHTIISHSDLWPTLLFGYFFKRKNPHAKWIAFIHMLSPHLFKGYLGEYTNQFHFPNIRLLHYWLSQKLFFFLAKKADNIITINGSYKEYFEKKFGNKSMIIRYGLSIPANISIAKEKKYDACFIGRAHPQKGIYDLIKIIKRLKKRIPNFKLALIGSFDDQMGTLFLEQIKNNGLEKHILYLGSKYGEEKYQILSQSKLFFFPSYYESFGIVYLEAISMGVPVIEYDLPIFIDHKYGSLKAKIGDTHDFAQLALKALNDNKLYNKISNEGLEYIKKFNWKKTADKVAKLFN